MVAYREIEVISTEQRHIVVGIVETYLTDWTPEKELVRIENYSSN